jgi:multisubunit Na+/H+ antiporter MnhG subunit
VFWAAAAGLIFVGVWVYKEYHYYEEIAKAVYTLLPATIIMAVGVFFFILGIIGCTGAIKEQRCLLGVFFTVMLIILVGTVAAAAMGFVYRHQIDDQLENTLYDSLKKYGNETTLDHDIDFMQKKIKCCGVWNYTDWNSTHWSQETGKPYPDSCCKNETCDYNQSINNSTDFKRGCYEHVRSEFLGHIGIVAGVAGTFAVLVLLGMSCACILICNRRNDPQYIGLSSPEHMKV